MIFAATPSSIKWIGLSAACSISGPVVESVATDMTTAASKDAPVRVSSRVTPASDIAKSIKKIHAMKAPLLCKRRPAAPAPLTELG